MLNRALFAKSVFGQVAPMKSNQHQPVLDGAVKPICGLGHGKGLRYQKVRLMSEGLYKSLIFSKVADFSSYH